jgi:hypothetical protein
VSVLALENDGVGPGSTAIRAGGLARTPQLNLRTYVTVDEDADSDDVKNAGDAEDASDDGDVGVYFLSLDTGRRSAAVAGRRAFGLPFHHATMRLTRRDDRVTFRSRRRGSEAPAVFQARYRPTGSTSTAEPGTVASFCVERSRYYLPASEDRRLGAERRPGVAEVRIGSIDRPPWELQPVDATIRVNTLFEAVGLPTPTADPVTQYSPGFEMGVNRLERRRVEPER